MKQCKLILFVSFILWGLTSVALPMSAHAEDFTLNVPVKLVNIPPEFANGITIWGSIHAEKETTDDAIAAKQVSVPTANGNYNGTITIKMNASSSADKLKAKYYLVMVMVNGVPIGCIAPQNLTPLFDQNQPMVLIQRGSLSGEQFSISPGLLHHLSTKFTKLSL